MILNKPSYNQFKESPEYIIIMRTLFITNTYLCGNQGVVYATKAFLNAFSQLSEHVDVLFPYKKGKEPQEVPLKDVTYIPVEDHRYKLRKFVDLIFGKVHRQQDSALAYIDSDKYDIVVFDQSISSAGLIKAFAKGGIKIITIHHNYQVEYIKGDSSIVTLIPELYWTRKYESEAVRYSNINLTLTKQDASLLEEHYGSSYFAVLGIFDYLPIKHVNYELKERGNHFIITGGLAAKQTEESLIPWIKHYLPVLKSLVPNMQLTIAGRNPSKRLTSIAEQSGIDLIASPLDMKPILDKADYYICPTDRGGGLKLRCLDGLKSGLPILTHSVSSRGYDYFVDNGIVFPYSDKETFEKSVKKMLSSTLNRNEIRTIYEGQFSPEMGVNRLKKILEDYHI